MRDNFFCLTRYRMKESLRPRDRGPQGHDSKKQWSNSIEFTVIVVDTCDRRDQRVSLGFINVRLEKSI